MISLYNEYLGNSSAFLIFSREYNIFLQIRSNGIDFKAFYTDNLNHKREIVGSLLGLLDIEANNCEKLIEPYLKNDKIRIVKTAFYVLSNLNSDKVFDFAKTNLFTNQAGLRNQIITYFGKNQYNEILEIVRNHYPKAEQEIKLSILRLFSFIGGYSIFPDLLLGTIDKSDKIRSQARFYLLKWKNEAINMFSKPTEDERERAIKIFNFVNEVHIKEEYFHQNPVENLDFYIK